MLALDHNNYCCYLNFEHILSSTDPSAWIESSFEDTVRYLPVSQLRSCTRSSYTLSVAGSIAAASPCVVRARRTSHTLLVMSSNLEGSLAMITNWDCRPVIDVQARLAYEKMFFDVDFELAGCFNWLAVLKTCSYILRNVQKCSLCQTSEVSCCFLLNLA